MRMGQLKYRASYVNKKWLEDNCFSFSRAFSDEDDPVYIKRFPVYKWGEITTIEAEIRLHIKTYEAIVDVYDGSGWTRGLYAPFYYQADYGHADFVQEITENIENYCKKLEFERIDE